MARLLLHNVQVARFVAAGAVLITHTADLVFAPTAPLFRMRWTFGVDIFFIISGFTMTYLMHGRFGQPGAAAHFLRRRVIRIVPTYWLFTTLMLATALAFAAYVRNATLAPAQIVTSYAFIPWPRMDGKLDPLLSQGWTLNYEMFFYLAFAGALLSRRGLPLLVAAFLALVAIGLAVPPSWFVIRFWSNPIILEFLVGIGLGTAYLRGVRLSIWVAIGCAAAGLLLALAPRIEGFGRFSPLLLLGFPAFLVCASLILSREPRRIGPFGKLLRAGGDASYSLYLSHTFTVNAVVLLWRHERLGPAWLAATAAASIAVAAAMIFYRYLEKPLIDRLRRAAGETGLRGVATVAP